jgi:hypothetical protein
MDNLREVVFHKIKMGDVDDPDLMVADPIWKWQQSDAGRFVMENAYPESARWERIISPNRWGWLYLIIAKMEERKLTEYYLRWGPIND